MATELLASQLLPWQPLVQLLAAVLFLLPLVYLLFFKGDGNGGVMDSASAPSPPGPPRQLPVLGNLLQIGSRPHRYFQAVARRRSKPIFAHGWAIANNQSPHLHARCQAIHRRGPPLLLSSRGYLTIIIPLLAQGVAGGRTSEDWPPFCRPAAIPPSQLLGESGEERVREMDENR
ncbi:hypothetical protein OsJ_23888 [Oryza sativa Japonica Group]|uniref:Uncharacterized protein n=1 Tax=Oryza sativa subsp. japonica TaxID=39947 RepID=A3BIR9_ORYSJ|nr:hypothetical protein OsJ_23888 [Oryza sativa Japonica Group]